MMKHLFCFLVLSFLGGNVGIASAACDLTVTPGDDIKTKLESAPSGSEICVEPGAYSATSQINLTQGALNIHGTAGCNRPVISVSHSFAADPQGPHAMMVKADDIQFENLEFHFSVPRDGIASDPIAVSNITVRNNKIVGGGAVGDECVELKNCTDCLAENNEVSDCGGDGISIVDDSVNAKILNNRITNTGLHSFHGENGAVLVGSNQDLEIACNRIEGVHNRAGIQFSKTATAQSGVSIHDNLFVNNPHDFVTSTERGVFRWRGSGETTGITGIDHNTVAYNGGAFPVHGVFLADSKPTFTLGPKNIFAFNTGSGMKSTGSPPTAFTAFDNNLFGNTLGSFSGPITDSGNLFLDPFFDADYVPTNPALAGYGWDPVACGTIGPICDECGNGQLEAGEECDDGNKTNADGCNSSCRTESCDNDEIIVGLAVNCNDEIDPTGEEENTPPGVNESILLEGSGACRLHPGAAIPATPIGLIFLVTPAVFLRLMKTAKKTFPIKELG